MNYKILKFHFKTEAHFGEGSLSTTNKLFFADTFFSAICLELAKKDPKLIDKLVEVIRKKKVLLSDAMPFIGDRYYIPKPLLKIKTRADEDLTDKKNAKKMEYIPIDKIDDYVNARLDYRVINDNFDLGTTIIRQKLSKRGAEIKEKDQNIYSVATYRYRQGAGLYMIIGYKDQALYDGLIQIIESLAYTGIGGKLSSGLGKFTIEGANINNSLHNRLESSSYKRYMTLSISLAREEELASSLEGAKYILLRRGGFVASRQVTGGPVKKRDLYMFKAGSSFTKKFEGDIYDVSRQDSKHPVYKYGKPIFMGVV